MMKLCFTFFLVAAVASRCIRAANTTTPNVVFILVDDLGEAGVRMNNENLLGTKVTELKEAGIYLSRHYVYKFCSPTRGSLLSGRYPFRLGNTRSNFIPWSRPDGLNLEFNTLQLRLQALGYSTHHVGKWHLGFFNSSFLPTNRGFDSYFGYLSGMQDHFTQALGGFSDCKHVVDLTKDTLPAFGQNGTYSGWIYNSAAVDVVQTAKEPFFLNYWMQNTHAPFEVPMQYSSLYNFKDEGLNTFNGMVSVVDEGVGNITAALMARGVWENTIVIYTHDNGAPLGGGGSNFPFRGGKNSNFEGGVRVPAIVSGGWLSSDRRNTTVSNLMHVSDWLPTLMWTLGHTQALSDNISSLIPYDGVVHTGLVSGDFKDTMSPPRNEIVLDHCLAGFSTATTGCNHFGAKTSVGALIVGEWKLVKGPNGGEWTSLLNGTKAAAFGGVACSTFCLFNLTDDAGEHTDLATARPDVLSQLLQRFDNLTNSYHPPSFNPPADDQGLCTAAADNRNFLVPWK
eukprot:m.260069 g.260069  ORF g.260069 m.260069 type:complete len:510 (+) comp39157_c0_seq1:85-1614(+)